MAIEQNQAPPSGEVSQFSMPAGAVFVSCASQDAEAAERIATALQNAGIEVWFDRSELRGGDAWDRQIREQIHQCRLFIAVISAHTEERDEGYFRREWKFAVDRTHDMDERKAFLVPVVIDATSERGAHVPEKFRELQWTSLPSGETPPAFVARLQRLLLGDTSTPHGAEAASGPPPLLRELAPARGWSRAVLAVVAVVTILAALSYLAIERLRILKPAASVAFTPPPHSIAVLPFVNMSGDKEFYAQWGDASKALEWLETALRLHDPGLEEIKVDPLLDPLHQQPRFLAVVRALKFPE